jgi:LPS export ABC transporter protein LptC
LTRRARGPAEWLVLVAASALGAAAAACGGGGARPTTTIQEADTADQVLEGFSHYVTSDGVRRTRVEADTAYFFEGSQLASLRRVRVTFYDPKGAEASRLTSRRGSYHWQDGSMDADGDVVVTGQDGRRLESEDLKFDNKANRISTDKPFRFRRGDEFIQGTGFSSDPDFKNVVTNQPRGVAGKGVLLPGQERE